MTGQPELLKRQDGKELSSAADWQERRLEILELLEQEEYGRMPQKPAWVRGREVSLDEDCCCGHAVLSRIEITFPTDKGEFTFPLNLFKNTVKDRAPLFLLINFRPDAYDRYYPVEEIIEHGFHLAVIYYEDITKDNEDMSDGLAGMFDMPDDGSAWGKIGMWAYGMSRAMDYLETLPFVDNDHVAFIGQSRLGKTALWAGAHDLRASYVISNNSGCSGAAYERSKHEGGEQIKDITAKFPFWFCKNYLKYAKHPEDRCFDQHYLLAMAAPRHLLVGSSSNDAWADPLSEQLCAEIVKPVWDFLGKNSEECVEYHLRDGIHFLGRQDWLSYMEHIEKEL